MSFLQHDYENAPHQPMIESNNKFPLFQRSINEMKLHESPIRVQKRSLNMHYSPIYRRSANGLSTKFHASYAPFVPVRIQKRENHFQPKVGAYRYESKRAYHQPHAVPETNSETRDDFSARSNIPVTRGYYPLF